MKKGDTSMEGTAGERFSIPTDGISTSSANVVKVECFHGGDFNYLADEASYVGGCSVMGQLNICDFTFRTLNKLIEWLGYRHTNVFCFFGVNGKVVQILSDEDTLEELRIKGVIYGKIELYLIHCSNDDGKENVVHDVYVSDDYSGKLDDMNIPVEIIDLSQYELLDGSLDCQELEEFASEPEEVVDDLEAGSSDEEFINVQMKKKDWIFERNNPGKKQIMKTKNNGDELSNAQVSETNHKSMTVKDDYWGADGDEYLEQFDQLGQDWERESDDEGPLNPSDDEEAPEVQKKHKWPLYDPNTPFGSVQLELGQLFQDAEVLRKALIYYSCQTSRCWKYCHNESHRVLVKCKFYAKECHWKLSARYSEDYKCLQIKFFKDIHTCTPTKRNGRVKVNFLAEEYQEKLLKHPTWKLKLFMRDIEDTYGIRVCRWQASRAKKNALSVCAKVVQRQYESLPSYIYELKTSNTGTSVFLELKPSIPNDIPKFHMFYINFSALRQGFLHGCRKVIGLDGAFLKGYCKGELLSATARDGNNQMFPVAWAIVDSESKESWSWFLRHMIDDLNIHDEGMRWTLLSDQQKGLLPAIAQLLPKAEHRLCARHIFTNWIKIIKGAPLHKLYWKAVKAYTEKEFEDVMGELKQKSLKAHTEMCAKNVQRFCRCYYKTWACTDVTCNNMAETFNSWILEAREKPILTMLEEIRRQVMSRMVEKKAQASKCNGSITPRIRAKLNDFRQCTRNWTTIEANTNVYEVQHTHNSNLSYAVDVGQRKCACRYWDVNGIPCEHATAAICAKNENPESYVASWYLKATYELAYSFTLHPLNGQALWKKVDEGPIKPSDPRVKRGRPSNKRKRAYGEVGSIAPQEKVMGFNCPN